MVQRGDMLDTTDVIDVLSIDLLGIVPDDESIIVSTNRGVPATFENNSRAGQAFRNIAGRLAGEEIPLMDLDTSSQWVQRLARLVRRNN
jgi:septum site-determining protein MinD